MNQLTFHIEGVLMFIEISLYERSLITLMKLHDAQP